MDTIQRFYYNPRAMRVMLATFALAVFASGCDDVVRQHGVRTKL